MGAQVTISRVNVAFQTDRPVIVNASLTIAPGEVVALVGSNGAGKSTLLRSLIGLVPATGQIRVDECSVPEATHRELRDLRRRTGFVSQRFGLAGSISAFSNVLHGALGRHGMLQWWAMTSPRSERDAAMTCLERVGLRHVASEPVTRLSGGQRQRVAVARMLLQRPTLLLADEPVASLDPVAGENVMQLIRAIAREDGMTVVMALHQLDLAKRFADRVVALKEGRVVLSCAPGELDQQDLPALYGATT